MRVVGKACACLLRDGPDGPHVLVFDHPLGGTQLPKGTVEIGELPEQAVVRELAEETGIVAAVTRSLGEWRRVTGAGPDELGEPEEHVWEIFEMQATGPHPDSWEHSALGSAEEVGLVFTCRWVPVAEAPGLLDPLFLPVSELLQRSAAHRG